MTKIINISKNNSTFQKIEVLKRNREKRNREKKFFVEGVRNIKEAIKNNFKIHALVYSSEKSLSKWAQEIIDSSNADFFYIITEELMNILSEKTDSSEIIAIVEMKNWKIEELSLSTNPILVVFDRPAKKGNLGTVIRSCDALGVDALIITGHAVDFYDPETIAASVGSFFNLPIYQLSSAENIFELSKLIKSKYSSVQIVGTTVHTHLSVNQVDFKKPTILLIGNETRGLSKKYLEISDVLTKIPMVGSASSLNVACANSIILYEIFRQRNI